MRPSNTLLPAVVSAIYLIAVSVITRVVVKRAAERASISTTRPFPWFRVVLVGVAVGGVLIFAGTVLPSSWVWALALFAMGLQTVKMMRAGTRFVRFFRGLDDACRSSDDTKIEALLHLRAPPASHRDYAEWAVLVLYAVRRAYELEQMARASAWAGVIDPRRVSRENGLALLQLRAALALATGQRDALRATLQLVPVPVGQRELEEPFAILRTHLAIFDGDASDTRLREVQTARARATGLAVDGWTSAEAHLRAARGDEHGALELMHEMIGHDKRAAVERMARHGGPASPLAARALGAQPYR